MFVVLNSLCFCRYLFQCKSNDEGNVADAVPQLAAADRNKWGISVCTVDGQRFSIGDVKDQWSIQAIRYVFKLINESESMISALQFDSL